MTDDTMPGHVFTVFGATGDLTSRKIIPALFHLFEEGRIGKDCLVLGVGRDPGIADGDFRRKAREALDAAGLGGSEKASKWCDRCVYYHSIRDGGIDEYGRLRARIEGIESGDDLPGNRIFYLALPPDAFPDVIEGLGTAGLNGSDGWTRLVVEKPFGRDIVSAEKLNSHAHRWFGEEQIFRIDHYLGKETVQNLLVFRFANAIFESIWKRERVREIQITVAESLGVGRRAGYYDRTGVVRDMVQNHIAQVLALIAMEVPAAYEAGSIRDEKVKVLRSVMPLAEGDIILGQYGKGTIGGDEVPGYIEEEGVSEGSATPTFAAMRLMIDNWRWKGTPFYIRTGKRLAARTTEVAIVFEKPPICFFRTIEGCSLRSNVLYITLQPDESFTLSFDVKRPGGDFGLEPRQLHFSYADAFGRLPDAYETLLLEIMRGDQTHFVHADLVEWSWRLFEPALSGDLAVHEYRSGSWGPQAAHDLLENAGSAWLMRQDLTRE